MADLQEQIEALWARRAELEPGDKPTKALVREAVDLLDSGQLRVAEVIAGRVVVHDWLRKAILLLLRVSKLKSVELGPFEYADKIPMKTAAKQAGVRVMPGAAVRYGSFVGRGAQLQPCFVNVGAYIGANSTVDAWVSVGSCAQVGANVQLGAGAQLGGALEDPASVPVVVEDDCIVGRNAVVADGARVGRGSVLAAGTVLTAAVPVVDASTGAEIGRGHVPAHALAVTGTRERRVGSHVYGVPCVLVLRRLAEADVRDRSRLQSLVREYGVGI